MNHDDAMVFLRAILIACIVVLAATAYADEAAPLPASYSCVDVQAAVAKYGRTRAIRIARRNGATAEQIAAAEKCL